MLCRSFILGSVVELAISDCFGEKNVEGRFLMFCMSRGLTMLSNIIFFGLLRAFSLVVGDRLILVMSLYKGDYIFSSLN